MSFATADLCDDHADVVAVAAPLFRHYGAVRAFCGPITTVKCHEDNSLVRDALTEAGQGRVLVVDGGGSVRCALVGDRLAAMGRDNGWAGIIVNGCIRDSPIIADIAIGVMALATFPRKSIKRGVGLRDDVVRFADLDWTPGAWVYADGDGVIVSAHSLNGG